jgi:hypothetical protein
MADMRGCSEAKTRSNPSKQDFREMRTGNLKAAGLAMLLALAAIGLTACGSGSDTTTPDRPAVSVTTADRLAKLSDRIATDLDAGDICHAAHAADDLRAAVEESDLPASLRPGVDAAAGDLVDQVNCPPPPPPPPPEEKKQKPKKGNEHGNGHGGGENSGSGHSEHGGLIPPGQAKLGGEQG